MSKPTPSLAQDLIRIHKVITRAIDVVLINGSQYLKEGFVSSEETVGYSSYTHSLVEVLDSHHLSEDQIIFPKMYPLITAAPYARLTAEHNQIAKMLEAIRPAIEKLPVDYNQGLRVIVETLKKLSVLWSPHYQMEEHYFNNTAVNRVMSPEIQADLSAAATKHSQDHSGPPYWVVPFVLFNLNREDRAAMASNMPPVIMEELVPKAWKDQWAPMKPLLLE